MITKLYTEQNHKQRMRKLSSHTCFKWPWDSVQGEKYNQGRRFTRENRSMLSSSWLMGWAGSGRRYKMQASTSCFSNCLLSDAGPYQTLPFIRQAEVSLFNVFSLIRVYRSREKLQRWYVWWKTLKIVCWFPLFWPCISAVHGGKRQCIPVTLSLHLSPWFM